MADEMKLLRAFIEASGYEIEEDVKIKTHEISYMQLHGMTQEEKNKWTSGSAGGMVSRKVRSVDYKVTKKEAACPGDLFSLGCQVANDDMTDKLKLMGFDLSKNQMHDLMEVVIFHIASN